MASAQVQEVAASEQQQSLTNQLQNGTTATLTNHTVANMQLMTSHSWSGSFTALPATITSHGGVARIDHLKGTKPGSKAGVIYTITSATGAPYAVVLAWNAPGNFNPTTSPNRVWGHFGPKADIERLTWDFISQEVDKAGSTVNLNDPTSKISMHATIIRNAGSNMANLITNFLLAP